MERKIDLDYIDKQPSTLLLGVLIHNKQISSKIKKDIEKVLKERGVLI